jgi:DNA gyrase subunit B
MPGGLTVGEDLADRIEVLTFPDCVRRRVEMYFPFDREPAWNVLIREGLCHAIEELALGRATFARVRVGDVVQIEDDGVGYSGLAAEGERSRLERVMTEMHTGCRSEHQLDRVRDEVCRASMAAVNAVSSEMTVESVADKVYWRLEFRRGHSVGTVTQGPVTDCKGLRFTFRPDETLVRRQFEHDALLDWWGSLDLPIPKSALHVE